MIAASFLLTLPERLVHSVRALTGRCHPPGCRRQTTSATRPVSDARLLSTLTQPGSNHVENPDGQRWFAS